MRRRFIFCFSLSLSKLVAHVNSFAGEDPQDNKKRLFRAPLCPPVELGDFVDEDGDGFGDAGEAISYEATFRNTGNVPVENARVSQLLEQDSLLCEEGFKAATSSNVGVECARWGLQKRRHDKLAARMGQEKPDGCLFPPQPTQA